MRHQWFLYPRKNGQSYTACKRCGIVQNESNRQADSCKGNVKVQTRVMTHLDDVRDTNDNGRR